MQMLKARAFRFDVGKTTLRSWPWFVRRAKRCSMHRVSDSDGVEVHTVHVTRMIDLRAIWDIISAWKQVDIYADYGSGFAIVGRDEFQEMFYKYVCWGSRAGVWTATNIMTKPH